MTKILNTVCFAAKAQMIKFLRDERGDVNIVSIVVLIGVAVLLAIVFKDAIGKLLKSLLETITKNSTDVVNTKVGG